MALSNAERVLDIEPGNAQGLDLQAAAKRALDEEQKRPVLPQGRKLGSSLLRRSLKIRMVIYFLVPSVAVVVALSTIAYLVARNLLEDQAFEQLEVTSNFKELEIKLFMEDVQENFNRIAALSTIRIAAASLLQTEGTAAQGATYENLDRLVESAAAPDLREIFFLTEVGGRMFFSTDKSREGEFRVTDSYYLRGLDGPVVQNIYPSPVTSDPTFTVATQLVDGGGGRVGVIACTPQPGKTRQNRQRPYRARV